MIELVVVGLCGLVVVSGVFALATPERFGAVLRDMVQTPSRVVGVAGFRVVFGLLIVAAAPHSRAPEVLRVLGVLLVAAGLAAPIVGLKRVRGMVEMVLDAGPWVSRVWGVVAVSLGVLVGYSVFG